MKSSVMLPCRRIPLGQSLLGLAIFILALTGCASGAKTATQVRADVQLEDVIDWAFEASHPAVIDQLTLSKVLKGLYRTDSQGGSSGISAGGNNPVRLFSDEDAELLSPLLVQALSKAKSDQLAGFRISPSAGLNAAQTIGSMYVQNGLIYVTISKGSKPTGFRPESAAHSENAPAYVADGLPGATSIVIDYRALGKSLLATATSPASMTPVLATVPTTTPRGGSSLSQGGVADSNASRETSTAREDLAIKYGETAVLRKESSLGKRELRERDKETQSIKKASAAPKSSAKTTLSGKPAQKKKRETTTQTP